MGPVCHTGDGRWPAGRVHIAIFYQGKMVFAQTAPKIAKPFQELTLDDWDGTMATNVRSLYLMTRAVLPAMRRNRGGTIVTVASLAGRNGFVGGTAYTASKHAVLGFSRSLMLELRKENIRVITVLPGSVATGMRIVSGSRR